MEMIKEGLISDADANGAVKERSPTFPARSEYENTFEIDSNKKKG